ncbi:UNVERIFIED_CONTAM: hypothetical protein HDU68_000900 [Siphonaria sp. JEL0065]|nr:hypothetical protein HDU68_000900 [Siphonaria sp. JEL0065]
MVVATNFFDALIIGDWGALSANLTAVATAMDTFAQTSSPSAIISTGDNFYSNAGNLGYDGILAADDIKFDTVWGNVFNGSAIKNLPWWTVMGNHDWNNNNSAVSELQHESATWILPDFFFTKRVQIDTGVYASFIFIETDFLYYENAGYSASMAAQFTSLGWSTASNTTQKQLSWIENAIADANNDAYIFVVEHANDWNNAGSATGELDHQSPLWVLPDYFYTKRVEVDTGVFASFIFIETDFLYYENAGYSTSMANQFTSLGWSTAFNTTQKQLAWIENAIAAANNDAYIFVVGHHPIYTCGSNALTKSMPTLLSYVNKWNVSGYMNGHEHSLTGYLTNGNNTLQIQSGSGGKLDKACAPLDQNFTAGYETLAYGFAHLKITKTRATVEWINKSGVKVLSLSVNARVPVVGQTPQPVLAGPTDYAIHYTKPTCNPALPPTPINVCKNTPAPSNLAALASSGPVNASTPTPFTGSNSAALGTSLAATFPSSIGTVDPALVAASLISANIPLTPGSVSEALGGNVPSSPTGLAAMFVTLTSPTYTFGPASNVATYGVESPFNITSAPITNGTEITYVVPTFVGSVWYAFNLTASLNLIVSINSNTSVLGSVSYQLALAGVPVRRQAGNGIVFTQGSAGVNVTAYGATTPTTCSGTVSATTTTCSGSGSPSVTPSATPAAATPAAATTCTGTATPTPAGNTPYAAASVTPAGNAPYVAPAGNTPAVSAVSYVPTPAGNAPGTTTKGNTNLYANGAADKFVCSAAVAAAIVLML